MIKTLHITNAAAVRSNSHLFTISQLAREWGIHQQTIHRAIKEGRLVAVRIGKKNWRITEAAAAAFIANPTSIKTQSEGAQ